MSMLLLLAFGAGNAAGDVYIHAEANLETNNTSTITLYQSADDVPATSLVLFLLINNDNATLLPTTSTGKDANQYAQLASAQQEAGFLISETFHTAIDDVENTSCLAVAVYKSNSTGGLQAGALLSCSLQLVSETIPATVEAATAENPITLNGAACFSSASTLDEKPLLVSFEPITISLNCESPAPPEEVKATRSYRTKIIITWEAPQDGDNLEYKVYRSLTDNVTESIPVNTTYTSELTWTDTFDDDETSGQPAGCSCALQYYYYWVRARDTLTGCVSDFSNPSARGAVFSQ